MEDKHEKHAQQAPEVVNMDLPEAVPRYPHPYGSENHAGSSTVYSGAAPYSMSELASSPRPYHAQAVSGMAGPVNGDPYVDNENKNKKRTICRCTTLVFLLCIIITVLLVTTIGLAVGTGIGFSRAQTSQEEVDTLRTNPSNVTFAMLDRNCTDDADNVTGTKYDTFSSKSTPSTLLPRLNILF